MLTGQEVRNWAPVTVSFKTSVRILVSFVEYQSAPAACPPL
jgi:hypothetical protein